MLSLLLFTLFCALPALAYKIDPDTCGDNAEWINTAMLDAFDMARKAVEVIDTPGAQRDANANRLIKLLFCGPNDDPATIDLTQARGSLAGVNNMMTVDDTLDSRTDVAASNDVIIYCDMKDRVTKNAEGQYVHKKHQQTLKALMNDEDIPSCLGARDATLAITWNLEPTWGPNANGDRVRQSHANEITICPWFVRWAQFKRFKTWSNLLDPKTLIASLAIPLKTKGYPLAPVDAFMLLDKVLLHELTHTISGGETVDVEKGFESAKPWPLAYGWRNALALAGMTDNEKDQRAQNNADTLALFASGLRLLARDPPIYVADDGSLKSKAPSKRRDTLPRELELKTTPAAFEGFVTLVRERQARATA